MKLPKTLLGAILIGVSVQITSCDKDTDTKPKLTKKKEVKDLGNCPACGMG